MKYFEDHAESDYLRTGGIAEETVVLDAGPLEQFSHAIEPQLRQLGNGILYHIYTYHSSYTQYFILRNKF